MGFRISKMDDTKLVSLCRERKNLIKAVVNCRYDLVSAHVMYFQSLLHVGDALDRFVEEDLLIKLDSSCDSSLDEDSHIKFHSSEENSHLEFHSSEEGSHLKFHASECESDLDSLTDSVHDDLDSLGERREDQSQENSYANYTRKSSTRFANGSYIPFVNTSSSEGDKELSMESSTRHGPYKNSTSSGASMDFTHKNMFPSPSKDPSSVTSRNAQDRDDMIPTTSLPSSHNPPETPISAWDYYNPFNIDMNDVYSYNSFYSQEDRIHRRTNSDNPDLRKVREREGIPDLEYDSERSSVGKGISKEKKSQEDTGGASGFVGTNFDDSPGNEMKSEPDTVDNHVKGSSGFNELMILDRKHMVEQGDSSVVDQAFTDDERDLQQAVKEIRYAFEMAFNCRKEVSMLLEVGKLPYQPNRAKLKEFVVWIRSLILPSNVISSKCPARVLSSRYDSKTMKTARAIDVIYKEGISGKLSDLSSILEKLYVWEKKLYTEVKVVEKLRVSYDKQRRLLKSLDDIGAEASKIDRTRTSIKMLLPKIKVSISAIDAISARIHKLREEALQSKVKELIEGLSNVWKIMTICHQKQFQALMAAKACFYITDNINVREDSSLKATRKLEKEAFNWANRFSDYVKTQKAFVKFLNSWLVRYLYQEKTPFETSPSRIGAPPIFIFCNDWCNALWSVSEDRVHQAISGFASSLQLLQEKWEEERRQRIKAENFTKEFVKQMQYLNRNGDDLVSSRKLVVEQKVTQEAAVRLVKGAASNCLSNLSAIFETLELFCSENLKAYEQIRIPNGSS